MSVTPVAPPHTSADQTAEPAASSSSALDFASQLAVYGDTDSGYPLQSSVSHYAELIDSNPPDYGRWDLEYTGSISEYMEGTTAQASSQYAKLSPRLPWFDLSPSLDFSNIEIMDALLFHQITPKAPKAPKAFWPRRAGDHQFSLNRRYILSTLRSYPYKILPEKILPPFIHPECLIDISRDDRVMQKSLPGPLATCAAIVQMCSMKNENNVIFIWKAIRIEQERLSQECSQYDDWTTVAALQAVTMYFLLRLSEDNDEATNFDIPLIYTMIKIVTRANRLVMKPGNPSDGSTPTWRGWVLAESLRRTIVVLCLIDLLFDVASSLPAYKCDRSILGSMELSSAGDLWKTTSSAEWKKQFAARGDGIPAAARRQLTYGDLVTSRFRIDHTLDSWLSQLDDFGNLVVAAASLPEWYVRIARIE